MQPRRLSFTPLPETPKRRVDTLVLADSSSTSASEQPDKRLRGGSPSDCSDSALHLVPSNDPSHRELFAELCNSGFHVVLVSGIPHVLAPGHALGVLAKRFAIYDVDARVPCSAPSSQTRLVVGEAAAPAEWLFWIALRYLGCPGGPGCCTCSCCCGQVGAALTGAGHNTAQAQDHLRESPEVTSQ